MDTLEELMNRYTATPKSEKKNFLKSLENTTVDWCGFVNARNIDIKGSGGMTGIAKHINGVTINIPGGKGSVNLNLPPSIPSNTIPVGSKVRFTGCIKNAVDLMGLQIFVENVQILEQSAALPIVGNCHFCSKPLRGELKPKGSLDKMVGFRCNKCDSLFCLDHKKELRFSVWDGYHEPCPNCNGSLKDISFFG